MATRLPRPTAACRDWSAPRRRAQRSRPPRRPRPTQQCDARASECLPQTDIDAERCIAVALVERDAEIKARWTEARVVAHAHAGTDPRRVLAEVRQGREIGVAGIEEGHNPERLADALT